MLTRESGGRRSPDAPRAVSNPAGNVSKEAIMAGSGTNIVILTGNLTKEPVLPGRTDTERATWLEDPADMRPCRISIAVDRPVGKSGKKVTDYFDVALFGKTARTAARYLRKGRLVLVEGALRQSSWDDTETGLKKYKVEVVARNFSMLDRKPDDETVPDDVDASLAPDA
jgi:single-strand DNA-binding protein